MATQHPRAARFAAWLPRPRPALAVIFLSGAGALIYESLWLRQITRAIGVTAYAIAAIVALYMAGLGFGAAAGARFRGRGGLRLFAALEAAAAACALLGTRWLLSLPEFIASLSADRPLPMLARLLLAAPAVLPTAVLLGTSLPVLARAGEDGGELYAASTLGAMAGAALASFWLIGRFGEGATLDCAAAGNAAAAGLAWFFSRGVPAPASGAREPARPRPTPSRVALLLAAAGFCALGYETLWSRQMTMLLGNSTYAFAMILIVYLAGAGIGSARPPARTPGRGAAESFGFLLIASGAAAAWSLIAYRTIALSLDDVEFLYSPLRDFGDFALLFAECAAVVFPFALIQGMLFPAALRAHAPDADPGAAAGRLYAWSAAGGVAGALAAGFLGTAWPGTHASLLLLAVAPLALGAVALATAKPRAVSLEMAGVVAGLALVGVFLARRDPALEIIASRLRQGGVSRVNVLFHDESPEASVVGVELDAGRALFINGIDTSGNGWPGTWMGLLPNLLVEKPRAALVVCLGVGNTFRAAARFGGAVDGVELVGDVARRMPLFDASVPPQENARGRDVFVEDGRDYLLRTRRRYDVIVVDAAPPLYSAGAVNLYTRDFLASARARLEDGGVFALWLPTGSFESDYWQILRGAADVFAHVAVWNAPGQPGFLILASSRPLERPPGEIERRIRARLPGLRSPSLTEAAVRAGFHLTEAEIRARAALYAPVTDDRPSVEFPLIRFWRGEPLERTTEFLLRARSAPSETESRARGAAIDAPPIL